MELNMKSNCENGLKNKLEVILKSCEKEIEKIGATIHPRSKRYSKKFKKNVVSFVHLGGKKAILIERLEVAASTIEKWSKEYKKPLEKKSFKAVQVVSKNTSMDTLAPRHRKNIILKTSSGCSVQFENLQDLAAVLRLIS